MDLPAIPSLVEIAIEPRSMVDRKKLGVALAKMVAEDASFTVFTERGGHK